MWQGQIFMGLMGLCGGAVVATALAAFIIELGIIQDMRGLRTQRSTFSYMKTVSYLGQWWEIWCLFMDFPFPLADWDLGLWELGLGCFWVAGLLPLEK